MKWSKVGKQGGLVYVGTYIHQLDDRNRISVPKKFRNGLGISVIVTKGLDGCLFMYALDTWERIARRIEETPLTKTDARSYARHILGGAMEIELDKLGRFVLPLYLKEFAHITNEIAILGVGERIELWDKTVWQAYSADLEKKSDEIAERLSDSGL